MKGSPGSANAAPGSDGPGGPALELSGTGRVILGMIALGRQTGYDIKQLVDASTRHFWAASYGQIYPELRRLEELGLVTGRAEPAGARARTVYELTAAGEDALRSWLGTPGDSVWELRDEGLLRLFFADARAPETLVEQLQAIRDREQRKLEEFRRIEPDARRAPLQGPYLALQFGIGMRQWAIDWCERTLESLLAAEAAKEGAPR